MMTRHPVKLEQLPPDLREGAETDARGRVDRPPRELRAEVFRRFVDELEPLRDAGKLGGILFQLPPYIVARASSYEYLEWAAEQLAGAAAPRRVPPPRAGSTASRRAETLRFLEERGMSFVVVDSPPVESNAVAPTVVARTGPIAYVRFHGRNAETWHKRGGGAAERFDYLYSRGGARASGSGRCSELAERRRVGLRVLQQQQPEPRASRERRRVRRAGADERADAARAPRRGRDPRDRAARRERGALPRSTRTSPRRAPSASSRASSAGTSRRCGRTSASRCRRSRASARCSSSAARSTSTTASRGSTRSTRCSATRSDASCRRSASASARSSSRRRSAASVRRAERDERGWFPVELTDEGAADELFGALPAEFPAFEWHWDTWTEPPGAVELARSEHCTQALRLGRRAWGIQFHAEVSLETIHLWAHGKQPSHPDPERARRRERAPLPRLARARLDARGALFALAAELERGSGLDADARGDPEAHAAPR